ncbi:RNA polymerase sigma factor [Streptomyces triculaminicus]|uniref:RNA polymerase sigma factor n=1 Tax=Streptomyces triculaminicus TaxID=2816232 RepID=UPI0037A64BD6
MTASPAIEDLLRELAQQVLGLLVRRHREFDACEDAVQEALLAAFVQWPEKGIPDNPKGWLVTVATRRLTDAWRSDSARQNRESTVFALTPADELRAPGPGEEAAARGDDTLTLLSLCCHPVLSPASRMALTLRAVGGLTTSQVARAFFVPDATMAQRISRAKQRIREAGLDFPLPPEEERERLPVVMHVLYLIFNEGYTASFGADLGPGDLTREAIRLTRELHGRLPGDAEVAGLLALMLLTEARRPARTGPGGILVPLAEQDRGRWRQDLIDEGTALLDRTFARGPVGPYQLQAAIAALHDEAKSSEDTDWKQILTLYHLLETVWPSPVVQLNRAVALAMVRGPHAALELLETLEADARMARHHRLHAVRAHLLTMAGDAAGARAAFETAARRTTSLLERRYLEARIEELSPGLTRRPGPAHPDAPAAPCDRS